MLFRTVYGPELEAIYTYLTQTDGPLSRQAIHRAFRPTYRDERPVSTQNIDDALSFLTAANLIQENGDFHANLNPDDLPFSLLALRQLLCLTRCFCQTKRDPLDDRKGDHLA